MCGHCGCQSAAKATILDLQTGTETVLEHEHDHGDGARDAARPHDHADEHTHGNGAPHSHAPGGQTDHHHRYPHEHVRADGSRHRHGHDHEHHHGGHGQDHVHADDGSRDHRPHSSSVVALEARILAKNDSLAATNRAWFAGREILALNLVSSPGAGKTTLLERTIRDLNSQLNFFVVEGDQATANDGERIRAAGAPVIQVNTGTGCHLEADMVARGLRELKPSFGAVVMIENVGNLICPAMFDLGEWAKVVILSVTEGEDKPLKYPHMFRAAEVMILNKIDLLPHVEFDAERAATNAREVNPDVVIMHLSARTGAGLDAWYGWVRQQLAAARAAADR
jgi:hydrogenase nickel incorporation protein HypB